MKSISVSDITLRQVSTSDSPRLSFNEKVEVAGTLDRLCVDVIETAPITEGKTDVLFLHTISSLVKYSAIACPVGYTEESVEETYSAVKGAKKPRLVVSVPVSTVGMEYICKKKPQKVLEMLETLTKKAASLCGDVEVSFSDATRAEHDFLVKAVECAVSCGASTVTVCDDAGTMLPGEFGEFVSSLLKDAPTLSGVALAVAPCDAIGMASADAVAAIESGAVCIKTSLVPGGVSLESIAKVLRTKGEALGVETYLDMTKLGNAVAKMDFLTAENAEKDKGSSPFDSGTGSGFGEIVIDGTESIAALSEIVEKMGYELSDDDLKAVYAEFRKTADKKSVGVAELDNIIAATAMQVAPTYKLASYVINSGDIITPTANIELTKDGESLRGFCIGDGPIDASFLAIEKITGHHYELDDFRIRSVTRGHEAMGSTLVKLRHNGKVFSGSGISTDIVGASINAYINALNKICFEEEVQ